MKEFSDEFLKDLVNQKADEFDPQDNLHLEWKNISKKLPRRRFAVPYFTIAVLTGVIILFLVTDEGLISEEEISSLKIPSSLALVTDQPGNKKEISPEKKIHEKEIKEIVKTKSKNTQLNHPLNNSIDRKDDLKGKTTTTLSTAENSSGINKTNISLVESQAEKALEVKSETKAYTKRDSTQEVKKPSANDDNSEAKTWSLYAGLFCNSNRFTPTQGDTIFIESFDQSGNVFANRLGLKLSLASPSVKTVLGKLSGTLSYGFLQKKYSIQYKNLTTEQVFENSVYDVHAFNHMLSTGLNLQFVSRISVGAEYQFVYNTGQGNDSFSSHYLMLNLTSVVYQKNKLQVGAFAEYGFPLKQQEFLNVHQINIGLRARIFNFSF